MKFGIAGNQRFLTILNQSSQNLHENPKKSLVITLVLKEASLPYPSKKSTIQKRASIWKPWPLEDPLLSSKQNNHSNQPSEKTSLSKASTHSLWSKVLTIQMVASSKDLRGLKGSASTCLPPLMDRSESNAKADLLNEVFINQNTSLAPDACVFWPSPLNVTFDLGNIYPSDVQRVLRS